MKKLMEDDLKDKKPILRKTMTLSKGTPMELPDDDLDSVAGGGVSEHVAKAYCPVCGFLSQYYNPYDPNDAKVIVFDHLTYTPEGCSNTRFDVAIYS